MTKLSLIFVLLMISSGAHAFSECVFHVDSVFIATEDDGSEMVWIELIKPNGGTTAIHKNKNSTLS